MVEKLPLDFVQKIYNMLTNGNDDVNFYCMCIQNQNREAATNSPIKFALNLIKINILCRLPFFKRKLFSEEIGKAYLSGIFVRPEICELASGMLDNSVLITDIFGSAVTTIKDKDHIFMDIEKKIKVKNFAKLRKQYSGSSLPINVIYEKINSKLKTSIDYNIELSIMETQYIPNKYGVRLLDIATCNNIYVTAIVHSGYPREFIEKILKKYSITVDKLIILSEGETDLGEKTLINPKSTVVFSSDYKGFIKKLMKMGCRPIYYRNPQEIMKSVVHPGLSEDFRCVYDGICGLNLFSGINRRNWEYELSLLCIAPMVTKFAQRIKKDATQKDLVICLCDESSFLAMLIKRLCRNAENILFFPLASPVTGGHRSVIKEKITEKNRKIVIANPLPNNNSLSQICSIAKSIKSDVFFESITLCDKIGESSEELEVLANIITGNIPSCKAGISGDSLNDVHRAILDFSLHFCKYTNDADTDLTIPDDDAVRLYMQGFTNIRNLIKKQE